MIVDLHGLEYEVGSMKLPHVPKDPKGVSKLLDEFAWQAAAGNSELYKRRRPIEVDGHPGREVHERKKNRYSRGWIILVNDVALVLVLEGRSKEPDASFEQAANRFFGSLKITSNPPAQ